MEVNRLSRHLDVLETKAEGMSQFRETEKRFPTSFQRESCDERERHENFHLLLKKTKNISRMNDSKRDKGESDALRGETACAAVVFRRVTEKHENLKRGGGGESRNC